MSMKKNRKGQAIVELSLVLPIFLLVIMGIFDFGRALHCWSSLNHQCVQAARAAAKRTNQLVARNLYTSTTHTSLDTVKKTFWDSRSPMMAEADYEGVKFDKVGTFADSVTVSASYNLTLITPFLSSVVNGGATKSGAMLLSASATEKKE